LLDSTKSVLHFSAFNCRLNGVYLVLPVGNKPALLSAELRVWHLNLQWCIWQVDDLLINHLKAVNPFNTVYSACNTEHAAAFVWY